MMARRKRLALASLSFVCCAGSVMGQPLTARNLEVPFCYDAGSSRSWPILRSAMPKSATLRLTAIQGGSVLAKDNSGTVNLERLTITTTTEGKLRIDSKSKADRAAFDLKIELFMGEDQIQQQ